MKKRGNIVDAVIIIVAVTAVIIIIIGLVKIACRMGITEVPGIC